MKYTIASGEHYAKPKKIKLHAGKWPLILDRFVRFDSTAAYQLSGPDHYDLNKLFGASIWYHQHNSARFAWRWNTEKKKIEIHSYVYSQKDLRTKFIDDIELNHTYKFRLAYYSDLVRFSIWNFEGALIAGETMNIVKRNLRIGYILHPYFGGNKTAPHTINIEIG